MYREGEAMKVIERGTIFDNPAGHLNQKSICFPAIEVLADGRLIANCQVGSTKHSADGDLFFFESFDGGKTWQRMDVNLCWSYEGVPGSPALGYLTEVSPGRLLMTVLWVDRSDPDAPFFHPETEGLLPVKTLLTESADGGYTWSEFREIDPSPFIQAAPTGPIMPLPDGTLMAPFEVNKEYLDPSPWLQKAGVVFSYDGGYSWEDARVVAHDPTRELFYWDQRHALLPDGTILAIFWTYNNLSGQDIDLHWAVSSDDGKTWTKPAPTGIAGQPSVPIALGGSDVLLLSVHRYEPPCLRALLSQDGGRTWDEESALVFYEKSLPAVPPADSTADHLQEMSLWTFGLPTGKLLPNGDVFCVYYAGDSEQMGVYWVRIAVP